jgi:restriction system protein
MAQTTGIPPYSDLLWPTLIAVRTLGGAGKIEEIDDAVIESEGFSEEQIGGPS